ncbi:MAG: hypothetical protein WCT04_16695 [Planctomycetota bacterium]
MKYEKHQICLCAIPVGKVSYPRPCVILDVAADGVLAILPISTKQYNVATKFRIDKDHPNFFATGLDDTSYVFDSPIRDAHPSEMIKILGALTGDLKSEFVKWIGE